MNTTDAVDIKGLASIIKSVKRELQLSYEQDQAVKSKPGLILRNMKIEISVIAEEGETRDGGFNLKIISLGTQQRVDTNAVHRVTLDFDIDDDRTYSRR